MKKNKLNNKIKKLFILPTDLRVAFNNAIKEAGEEIKNSPPIIIAKRKKDDPKALLLQKMLNKWWRTNGFKIFKKIMNII